MKIFILLGVLFSLLFSTPIFAQAPTKICFPNSNANSCQDVTSANPFPVAATASIGGFQPNGGYGTLTATGSSSSSTAIPSGTPTTTAVRLTNNGTTEVSCTFATGAATGLANNTQIPNGASVVRNVGTFDHVACIDQTGSASNIVVLESGIGLGVDSGGGGSSGGAVTIADGAAVTIGSLADAKSTATDTTPLTLMQVAKEISFQAQAIATNTSSAIPPQTAPYTIIGGVINGADTYNTIAASQSAQALTGGSGGAIGDYLSHCVIQPTTTAAATVTIADNSTTVFTFTTGTLSNLVPFTIPVGAVSVSGAWKITTGANETATCVGKFH
jgi:hypothetical protein